MNIKAEVGKIGVEARKAAGILANISSTVKNRALLKMADDFVKEAKGIIKENVRDLAYAKEQGLSGAMIDRLTLTEASIKGMAEGLEQIAALPDPVGEVTGMRRRPNGLLVGKRRIPLGVIGIIYESRPNVTADAAALCLKSGNAVILRGGSEAIHSNLAIARILQRVLRETDIPETAIQIISTTDRDAIAEMLKLEDHIDLIIPRGGEGLIRAVVDMSRIPVLKHYKGVCHVFVDESADIEMAVAISLNAKAQRPGVCNSMETLLVHSGIAGEFLPVVAGRLREAGVVLKGCEKTRAILADIEEAIEADWYEEYLDLILAIRVVENIEEAMAHIEKYGSLHTESIVTSDYRNSQRFLNEVNSSTVVVNASTRFSDGFELGLGAEMGISTTKLHAFGPMGLEELTTTKFIIYGDGQIRT